MDRQRALEEYDLFERDWENYEELYESFEWNIPNEFNIASYTCDRWGNDHDRIAIYAENKNGVREQVTYQELRDRANQLANFLVSRGISRGDKVGINTTQRPETAISHLAVWKVGAVSVPLSTQFGPDALEYRLQDSGAKACIVTDSTLDPYREIKDVLEDVQTTLVVGTKSEQESSEKRFQAAIKDESTTFDNVRTRADDEAIILYTSGTTGDPKGVLHTHDILLSHLPTFVCVNSNLQVSDSEVYWIPSEWSWIASLFDVLFPAMFYGQSVLAYESKKFEPRKAFELIDRYDVSVFIGPPTALRMMKQEENISNQFELQSVRHVTSGGESVGEELREWVAEVFDANINENYGQTEANGIIGECTALMESRPGTMGKAVPGHEIQIVDPDDPTTILEPGEVGEIAVQYENDPVCFEKYWNKPELTAAKVEDGWLLTEDLGRMDKDGYVTFNSRKDEVIISAGYRISPQEVENTLASHDKVADVGVTGVPDQKRGKIVKAFVVLEHETSRPADVRSELQQYVKDELAKYEYPRKIEFVDTLPKTSTGKIQRSDLS